MLNSRWAIALCMVSLALFSVNCTGKGGDAIAPSVESPRAIQSFNNTDCVFPLAPAEDTYLGVDLATVRDGDYPVDITVNGDGMKLTAMVSLKIEDIAGPPPYIRQTPSLAWLGEVNAGDKPDVLEEITFGTVGGQTLDYRNVHVAVWYDSTNETVEVAVSFEWHLYYNGAWLPWAPGVWFMQWNESAFSDGTPGAPTDEHWFLPKPTGYPGGDDGMNCWGQDIAVDPSTGDIYLLYINQDNIGDHPYRSYFFVLEEGSSFTWSKVSGCPWEAFDYDWIINCWTLSIDVGIVDLGSGDAPGVAIAFTAQDMYCETIEHIAPLCVVGTGWYTSDNSDEHPGEGAQVIPGTYDSGEDIYYNCGAPSIDIAPEGNYDPWWAIAYVQAVEDEWDYDSMFIDSVNLAAVRLHDGFFNRGRFGASVTCHVNYSYRIASVSAYEVSPSYGYQPAAAGFNVGTQSWNNNYTRVQTDLPTFSGTYDPLDLLLNNPGITTSIVSNSFDGKYYLGFSSNIEPTPSSIYAACGNTT